MKSLIAISFLFLAGNGWAMSPCLEKTGWSWGKEIVSISYSFYANTDTWKFDQQEWTVIRGTQSYTLSEFVKSGRFCAIYGHMWPHSTPCPFTFDDPFSGGRGIQKCRLCFRPRKKMKVNKVEEVWEP